MLRRIRLRQPGDVFVNAASDTGLQASRGT